MTDSEIGAVCVGGSVTGRNEGEWIGLIYLIYVYDTEQWKLLQLL
jgi:hypothetical protein